MAEQKAPERPEGKLRPVALQVELEPIPADEFPVSVVQVLPVGDVHIVDARDDFKVSALSVLSILTHFGNTKTDLAYDYDHGMYYGDNMLAAGWGEKVWAIVPNEWVPRIAPFIEEFGERVDLIGSDDPETHGVYVFTRWTAEAALRIKNREYRYISPVVFFNYAGEAEYLWNAALVNQPAIDGMEPLAASLLPPGRATQEPEINQGGEAAETKGAEDMKIETFAAVLEIDVDPTAEDFDAEAFEAQALEAYTNTKERAARAEALAAENEQVKAERDEVVLALAAATEERDKLAQEKAENEGVRKAAIVDEAIATGKLAPSQREWACENFAAFETLLPTLDEHPQGPPQGQKHEDATKGDSIDSDDPDVALVKACREYAAEHKCSFTDAYIKLGSR